MKKLEANTLSHHNTYSISPELGELNLLPGHKPQSPIFSQIEGPCTCHVHELTQMNGLSLESVSGHVHGRFRFGGLS